MAVKLSIYKCNVDNGQISRVESEVFKAMINPSTFSHSHGIEYQPNAVIGTLSTVGEFSKYTPEEVSFELILDGTGVVVDVKRGENNAIESVSAVTGVRVVDRIKQLKKIVFDYEGSEHRPNVVSLVWGTFAFNACLTSINIEYTMFDPQGEPLRAKAKLGFKQYMSKQEEAHQASKTSPDLTHIVEVRAGDTLPLLCQRIYKNEAYFPEVAKVNKLSGFRHLKPGTRLIFPPLR